MFKGSILSDEENLIAEQIKKEERSYKPLLESEVNHLKTFLKKLEESVKKSVMEEGAMTSVGNIANIDTRKMSFRETIVINHKTEALNKEIETFTMMYERKKQELQNKLSKFSNTNVKNEVDCINSVLNMFNVDFKLPSCENMKVQNVKIDSAPLPDQMELLSLHNSSNKVVVNKLVLE